MCQGPTPVSGAMGGGEQLRTFLDGALPTPRSLQSVDCRCAWVTLYGLSLISACGPSTRQREIRSLTQTVEQLQVRLHTDAQRLAFLDERLVLVEAQREEGTAMCHGAGGVSGTGTGTDTGRRTGPVLLAQGSVPLNRAEPLLTNARGQTPSATSTAGLTPALRRALADYRRGAFQTAFTRLGQFVRRNPQHADADRARFWMGECKFEAGALMESIAQFARLERDYPDSPKAPEALMKMGLAFEKLAAPSDAAQAYRRLIMTFPHSAPAELASSRLSQSASQGRTTRHEDDHARP